VTGKRKQRIEVFCRAYIIDLNATSAAKQAGYSEKTAYSQGHDLLKKPEVMARIAELQKKQCDKLDITAERVLAEIAKLGYANMLDYVRINAEGHADVDLSQVSREQAAAIQEIRVDTTGGTGDGERRQVLRTSFKLADKGANLERLGKHLKLFTDKHEHSFNEGLADRVAAFRNNADS